MNTNQLELSSVESFLQSIEDGSQFVAAPEANQSQQNSSETKPTEVKPSAVQEGQQKSAEEFLEGMEEGELNPDGTKKTENKPAAAADTPAEFFKDAEDLSKSLSEKGFLFAYEDGSLPKTKDELFDALSQSVEVNVSKKVDEKFQQELESLPPAIQTIIEYGKKGVTTATELQQFIGKVSNYEAIAGLDPTKPEHQESIVMTQLINSGFSEASAKKHIAMLVDNNQLEEAAKEHFPILKKAYGKQVESDIAEKQQKEDYLVNQIQTNETYVKYYLDQVTDYLPFKIDKPEHKAAVYELAAGVHDFTEDGTPIYGWQAYVQNLQHGDETAYKKYMKIMNFIANDDYYDKKLSKSVSNATTNAQFKKISTTTIPGGGTGGEQGNKEAPLIRRPQSGPLSFE